MSKRREPIRTSNIDGINKWNRLFLNQLYFHFHFHFDRHTVMASSGKFVALFKQGLNEIPEVIASGVVGMTMAGVAITKIFYDSKQENFGNKKYKLYPIYMRPDDPRAAKVHKA